MDRLVIFRGPDGIHGVQNEIGDGRVGFGNDRNQDELMSHGYETVGSRLERIRDGWTEDIVEVDMGQLQ